MPAFPPTIIVVHPRERRSKCTVSALRGQPGFEFWKYLERRAESLDGYVRLGFGGPLLSDADASAGLLVLDGTWRLASPMEKSYADVPVRSLPAIATAYPRVSKTSVDPTAGLATIEAIYAAYRMLRRNADSLLDDYRWREEFLALNGAWLASL